MKYTKKDYAKFNIDLSKCETYDDVVICTVEGNINNGAPIDKHMFAQYCDIVEKDAINEFLNEAFSAGTALNFSNGDCNITKVSAVELKEGESLKVENGQVIIKKASLIKRLWNWITRKNK